MNRLFEQLEALKRKIGSYSAGLAGPLFICVGGIHGNEPAGVIAAQRVLKKLHELQPEFRGEFHAFTGNLTGLREQKRYIDHDMNRQWLRSTVERIHQGHPESNEEEQIADLLMQLESLIKDYPGPSYFVDLHTASSQTIPFIIYPAGGKSDEFVLRYPAPAVMLGSRLLDGTLFTYMAEHGATSYLVEGGRHDLPSSVDHLEAVLWIGLREAGLLGPHPEQELNHAYFLLMERVKGIPRSLEVTHRYRIQPEDGFIMRPGYKNFQVVHKGEIVADDHRGKVEIERTARIFLPLYQAQGDDGFFLVDERRPELKNAEIHETTGT